MMKVSVKITKDKNYLGIRSLIKGTHRCIYAAPPPSRSQEVLGEAGEEQAVIIDGTSAEL